MKTAGRENPKRWATMPRNREHGAAGQNRSCSIQWAAKQENFQPAQKCFFLTSSFIEQIGKVPPSTPSFRFARLSRVDNSSANFRAQCQNLAGRLSGDVSSMEGLGNRFNGNTRRFCCSVVPPYEV